MTHTTPLARLILKKYYRNSRDASCFEWVSLEDINELISPIARAGAELTEIGAWIYPIEVEELKERCRQQIEDDGEYITEAISIVVLAGWKDLGPVAADYAQHIGSSPEGSRDTVKAIDWEHLVDEQELDSIEDHLLRILRDPSKFEGQREGLKKALNIIRNGSPSGPLAIIALRRLGEDPELLRPYLDKSDEWEERAGAHIALVDDLPKDYFSNITREEFEFELKAIDRFLAAGCAPDTPPSDLELVRYITEEPLLKKIFFNDQRLRAPRESYTGLLQAAVAGEELTDGECALLLAAIEGKHPFGGLVLFDSRSRHRRTGFGYHIFSTILACGGPETRALLLHRLFSNVNLGDYLNPLLVLHASLDGPRSWIEPTLTRFYGLEQSEAEPWLEGDGALLIETLQNAYQYDLESIAVSLTEAELRRRPGLLSRMWNHPDFLLRQRAWRVASGVPGAHPLLSPPADPSEKEGTSGYSRPSVAVAHILVSDEYAKENRQWLQSVLSQIEPEAGWPAALERLIRWKDFATRGG